ncbi:hypothetical protein [Oceanirhabdus seepicola]|uniref:Uncharacterized protein n=1 Tax=Oceanirhabdus seepicola TaxID=2828781 RepID=A0A9J6NZF0_9CLOT|nr:hypothetical protein [Oceanirhabdus seepicola]MCM1989911.1 hypothetical protein [Oceanirhabdus seepicola]
MAKYYYCLDCLRISSNEEKCEKCEKDNLKVLKVGTPVNVIGTKQKGKVFQMKDDVVKLIVITQAKEKVIKEFKPDQLKKLL